MPVEIIDTAGKLLQLKVWAMLTRLNEARTG